MIRSFGDKLAEAVFHNRQTKETRRFVPQLYAIVRRKLFTLHYSANIEEMALPPGNRLEKLKGNRQGVWSVRINDQWRMIFRWDGQDAHEVEIIDYH